MNNPDFRALRDLSGKSIDVDIKLVEKAATHPLLTASRIPITNPSGVNIVMNVNYNLETGAKTINVTLIGEGPICRLDVDGACHGSAGRSHKHSVQDDHSVARNLRDGVQTRADLSGKTIQDVFADFCAAANINHNGTFEVP